MAAALPQRPDAERVLVTLLGLERELLELEYVRRSDALERVADAARRLGDGVTADGLLERAGAALLAASDFDRVVFSDVVGGMIAPVAVVAGVVGGVGGGGPQGAEEALTALGSAAMRLEYPLFEYEVVARRAPQVVSVSRARARTPAPLARALGWESYVVAPLIAGGETIGLLHADATAGHRTVDGLDAEVAGRFAEELSSVLERAVLRHTLELHRGELAAAVQWMGTRLHRLEDAGELMRPRPAQRSERDRHAADALTPRELDVLRLMARGQTNLAIARTLLVREGTIKYHVKNILRKLGATSRADAVARFVRAGGTGTG